MTPTILREGLEGIRPKPRVKTRAVSLMGLVVFLVLIGCSKKEKENYDEPTAFDLYQAQQRMQRGSARPADTSHQIRSSSTGNPDHDFLRAVSDHDKNLIVLSDAALESSTSSEMGDVIRRIEDQHSHELHAVTAFLRAAYSDRYVSLPTNETRSTADALRRPATDRRVFLDAALASELQASRMIDSVLPTIKREDVRSLARRLKITKAADTAAIRKMLTRTGNP